MSSIYLTQQLKNKKEAMKLLPMFSTSLRRLLFFTDPVFVGGTTEKVFLDSSKLLWLDVQAVSPPQPMDGVMA